ncbi:MAG: Smr/MutS family protein [Alphaproteobacteria bacterium]|nr:Smr/MutS family protein [Alphaproteobacteria bacterium]
MTEDNMWELYKATLQKIDRSNIEPVYIKPFTTSVISRDKVYFNQFTPKANHKASINTPNRKERRKFKSEATIDLHGFSRDVDSALNTFCYKCRIQKLKMITIITGKGSGIVKNFTQIWIEQHPEHIESFFQIKDSKMESGSFAVTLRKYR